jgi:hypothetical protein
LNPFYTQTFGLRRWASRNTNDKVVDTYARILLIIAAAMIAVIGQVLGQPLFQSFTFVIIFGICTILLLLGIFTLDQSILDSISIVLLWRRAGRIRLWFVEKDVKIAQYVPFHFGDDRPRIDSPFLGWRGGEAVIFVINTFAFCGMIVILLMPKTILQAAIIVIVSGIAAWMGQVFFMHRRLKTAEKWASGSIRFPYAKMYERLMK